jgi:hypothetical protein
MVADLVGEEEWVIQFRRGLDGNQVAKLRELQGKPQGVRLSEEEDEVRWAMEKVGVFQQVHCTIFDQW